MPIVYVHGVATRAVLPDPTVVGLMKRYLSDVITPGRDVEVVYAYWGDVAARFAWNGASRPRAPLLGMGGVDRDLQNRVILASDLSLAPIGAADLSAAKQNDQWSNSGGLVPAGPGSAQRQGRMVRLRDFAPDALSDFLAALFATNDAPQVPLALLIAADEVALRPETAVALNRARDVDEEWAYLTAAISDELDGAGLEGQGASSMSRLGDRVIEYLNRGSGVPGYVASRLVAEFRAPMNNLATTFIGDVFEYLGNRGTVDAVGPIPGRFLAALRRARDLAQPDEPVIVISHSMGGQIVYDAITTFLPGIAVNRYLRVDYWCATASQVGLFEELKLFLSSTPDHCIGTPVPFPDRRHLGGWWNVWDHNDFLSYTVRGIIADVDDEPFDSGMSLATAHSGYLVRPTFFRRLAEKLAVAAEGGWGH